MPTGVLGPSIRALMAAVAVSAPWLATDPLYLNPIDRLKPPSTAFWFCTDHLRRDVSARTGFGTRTSLTVRLAVATFGTAICLHLGPAPGSLRPQRNAIPRRAS